RVITLDMRFDVTFKDGKRAIVPAPAFAQAVALDPEKKRAVRRLASGGADASGMTVAQVGPHDLIVQTVVEKKALIGGTRREESVQARSVPVDGDIVALRLDGRGDDLVLGTSRGQLVRYDMRDRGTPTVVETATVGAAPVTALSFLIGERTLVAADATGAVS